MKKILTLIALLTVGLFFIACGDSESKGFTKTGKAGPLKVTYASAKPLVVGDNTIEVGVSKDAKPFTGAKVEMKVFMPEMPGMPAMSYRKVLDASGDKYSGNINFSMGGTWQVKIYIEKDGKKYRHKSSVIL